MSSFPAVLILDEGEITNSRVQENKRYSLWIGRKNDEVSHFTLSACNDAYTIGKMVLKVDAEFTKTDAFVDVYKPCEIPNYGPVAKFWSPRYTYAYEEKQLDEFINDNTERDWEQVLGVPVSFYPFGGPADKPGNYPDFDRKPAVVEPQKTEQVRTVSKLSQQDIDDGYIPF